MNDPFRDYDEECTETSREQIELFRSHGGRDESGFVCAECKRSLRMNEACYCGDEYGYEESDDRPEHGGNKE